MGKYKDRRNFKDHDFNTTTVLINKEHKIEGLESLEVAYNSPRGSTQEVGDGMAIHVNSPSKSGTIKFSILEASPSNDEMWDLLVAGNSFSCGISDTNSPNLEASGQYCKLGDIPPIKRSGAVDVVEWHLNVTYLDARGGGYSLATPA